VLGLVLGRWRVSSRILSVVAVVLVTARLGAALVLDPFPTQTYPSYATYERLAREPERFTVLEVPFGVRSGLQRIGDGGEALQFYQHVHGKPLLNGMIARLPSSVFDAYGRHPSLRVLSGTVEAAAADDLREVLRWTNARYILVHRGMLQPDQQQRIENLLHQVASVDSIEHDLVLYRV
jgi:hypothetical protein